jgi:hypothetical protein
VVDNREAVRHVRPRFSESTKELGRLGPHRGLEIRPKNYCLVVIGEYGDSMDVWR